MSDGYFTITDRSQEERDYRNSGGHEWYTRGPNGHYREHPEPQPAASTAPPPSPCLQCGFFDVEYAKHFGHVYVFDKGTENIHVCRETYANKMRRIRRELWEERNRGK